MTAWGDGTPSPQGVGAHSRGGPPPRRDDDTRVVILVVMFTTALVLVGVGAFLVGRGPNSGSGSSSVAVTVDAPMISPPVTTTDTTTTVLPAPTDAPATSTPAADTTTPTASIVASTVLPTAGSPTTTQVPPPVDNSARAQADLQLHFDNHDRVDLVAAYGGLSESFAPPFDEFVAFWGTDVAAVDSPIDGCTVTNERGICRVRFFITYSDAAADERIRGTCVGQRVELTMQEVNSRFLIDAQRNIEPLACP